MSNNIELVCKYLEIDQDYAELTEHDNNIVLHRTCGACPEQYRAYIINGDDVIEFGYLRLRHGYFYAETAGGEVVYEAEPNGDGIFECDERSFYLNNAIDALFKCYNS